MLKFVQARDRGPVGARHYRAYVVGDIHGRLDLLDQLLAAIEDDLRRRPARKVLLVFVGDLIDRGPASAGVVERLRTYQHRHVQPVFLLGNHEEVMLRVLRGDAGLIKDWCRFGGTECLQSYGVDTRAFSSLEPEQQLEVVRSAIPKKHVEFIESFIDTCRFGDYLFVHAGIRPGVELDQQLQSDLRWIREPFLLNDGDHGFVVVHGHTITDAVDERHNRIGIDTGAYRTGVLTALAIEGSKRWQLVTERS